MRHYRSCLFTLAYFVAVLACVAVAANAQEDRAKPGTDLYGDPLPEGAIARFGTLRFRPRDTSYATAASPDGKRIAVGSWPGYAKSRVEIFDAETGKLTTTLVDDTSNIISLAWSPDAAKLVIGHDYRAEVWDVAGKKLMGKLDRPQHEKPGGLRSLQWSRDARWIAAYESHYGINSSHVWLWDATTRKLAHSAEYDTELGGLDFSPDSKHLAICGRGLLAIRSVETLGVETETDDIDGNLCSICYSPDGKTLVTGIDASEHAKKSYQYHLRFWDAQTGTKRADTESLSGTFPQVKYVGSSAVISTDRQDILRVWDTSDSSQVAFFRCPGAIGWYPAVTANGGRLFTADRRIAVWDTESGQWSNKPNSHYSDIRSVALVDGNRLVSGGTDGVALWDRRTSGLQCSHRAGPYLAVSRDGKLVASSNLLNGTALWEVATAEVVDVIEVHDDAADRTFGLGVVTALDFSPDDKLLASGGQDGAVCVWSLDKHEVAARLDIKPTERDRRMEDELERLVGWESLAGWPKNGTVVTRVKFSADGKWLGFGTMGGDIELINTATWKRQVPIPVSGCLFFAPFDFDPRRRGVVVPGIADRPPTGEAESPLERATLRLWDIAGRRAVWTSKPTKAFWCIGCSPDGRLIATSATNDGDVIRLWSAENGAEVGQLKGHTDAVRAFAFTPDGATLYSGSQDTMILAWDLKPFQQKVK